jgi:hypothetical protein
MCVQVLVNLLKLWREDVLLVQALVLSRTVPVLTSTMHAMLDAVHPLY